MIQKKDLQDALETHLGRPALFHEIENAKKDVGLLVPLLTIRIQNLEDRISLLEKK